MAGKRSRWVNIVILDNEKDAIIVAAKEKLGSVNTDFPEDMYPLTVELPMERSYLSAIKRSVEYSKMGIFNLFVKRD